MYGGGLHGGGTCVVGGVCGTGGVVGGHAWLGTYVAGGGMHGGCAWQILRDTVNERVVRILLKCILVYLSNLKHKTLSQFDIFIIVQNIQHIEDCNNL